jgi:hypothetical protein
MKHVDAIVTPRMFQGFQDGEDMGDQKTSQLKYLVQTYGQGSPVDIILVDDTEPNTINANAMGYKGVHVKGEEGIDDDDLSRIHQAMESLDFSKKCVVALDFDLTMCKTHLTSAFCYKYIQANGGVLDTAGLMKVIPEDILAKCVPQLMSFGTGGAKGPGNMILLQGRVIDPESGFDQVCDVVLKDGTIDFVGKLSEYTGNRSYETIDCEGLAVVPGFIDTHAHGQDEESSRLQACDGVTTHLEMEFGAFPVSSFYESRENKAPINYGCTVGHIPARIASLSPSVEAPKVAQCCLTPHLLSTCICTSSGTHDTPCNCGPNLAELRARIEQGLNEGGLGIGMGIAYVAAANHEEIYRMFKIGADYQVGDAATDYRALIHY